MGLSRKPFTAENIMPGTDDDLYDNSDCKIRYEAYSRLQAAAVAFGESLPIPEIVAIGGQSDGKSSLLEAFLGFRFNVREVEMGTRRPLIVQMVTNPECLEPRCRLQEEDSEEYGPVIQPASAVAGAIKAMTETHLKQNDLTVSAKPIVMRAEYAYCPNLTIIDTPGFILKARKGEPDTTPDDILDMVKAQALPPHRLILFLQQSSVEWCSSLWMHVVQEVDPNFRRTVVVSSKFDNRLKEFGERWEVDRYLSAAGYLNQNVQPFFVALPKDRAVMSSKEWRHQIQEVDTEVYKTLRNGITGGFDEEKFGNRIGFGNLKGFLEDELARRYRDAAPTTLALLQARCQSITEELFTVDGQLKGVQDVASLRKAGMQHVHALARNISGLMDGSCSPDPAKFGLTSDDERINSSAPNWPGLTEGVNPSNSQLRLYGGAAFERCLSEFQEAASRFVFPSVARDKVANMLLAVRARGNSGGGEKVAIDLARDAAREQLKPLLEAACSRLASVLHRSFEIAVDAQQVSSGPQQEMLRPYVAFQATLRSAYHAFVLKLEEECKMLLNHQLQAGTSEFAVGPMSMAEAGTEEVEDVSSYREPLAPLGSQMTVPETPSPDAMEYKRRGTKTRHKGLPVARITMDLGDLNLSDGNVQICNAAERCFAKIRTAIVTQTAPTILKSAFLEPMGTSLASQLSLDLFARADKDFMQMFAASGAVAALEARRDALARRVTGLVKCKNEFQELARCL